MADDDTTNGSADGGAQSPEGAGGEGTDPQKVIEDLRKRQSGADKAKEAAIAERDAYKARLDALLSGNGGQSGEPPKDAASIRAEVEREYEAKLAEARKAAQAEALDARFPAARKFAPEVYDAAKLAELEVLLTPASAAPKPIGNNPQGQQGSGGKRTEDMSVKELRSLADQQLAELLNPKS